MNSRANIGVLHSGASYWRKRAYSCSSSCLTTGLSTQQAHRLSGCEWMGDGHCQEQATVGPLLPSVAHQRRTDGRPRGLGGGRECGQKDVSRGYPIERGRSFFGEPGLADGAGGFCSRVKTLFSPTSSHSFYDTLRYLALPTCFSSQSRRQATTRSP